MTHTLRHIAAALALLAALPAVARTAAQVFTEAPMSVLPLLRQNTRLDMLDYYNHSMANLSPNNLGGEARITECSDSRIELAVSRDATVELALVPVKGDTIVALIETVLTPVADSSIKLYSSDWQPLPSPAMPGAEAFSTAGKGEAKPDIVFMKASYDPATGEFVFRNTTAAYYAEQDRPAWLPEMKQTLRLRYDARSGTFKP